MRCGWVLNRLSSPARRTAVCMSVAAMAPCGAEWNTHITWFMTSIQVAQSARASASPYCSYSAVLPEMSA